MRIAVIQNLVSRMGRAPLGTNKRRVAEPNETNQTQMTRFHILKFQTVDIFLVNHHIKSKQTPCLYL